MASLPRVLLCCYDCIPGPTALSRRVSQYLAGLSSAFELSVLCVRGPDQPHLELFGGSRLMRVPVKGTFKQKTGSFQRATARLLESERYDLVHFFDPFSGFVACEHRGEEQTTLVCELQHLYSAQLADQATEDEKAIAWVKRLELLCLMSADHVITGSAVTARFLNTLGASMDRITVVRAPVDLTRFRPPATRPNGKAPLRVVYLGGQEPHQGVETAIRALPHALAGSGLSLTLITSADEPLEPGLAKLITGLRLTPHVHRLAALSHDAVAEALGRFDVGLVPLNDSERNHVHGGPLAKLSDYLGAELPVVLADLPLTRELSPPTASLFFPPGDFKALAAQLTFLQKNPGALGDMRAGAKRQGHEMIDARRVAGVLASLYRSLLEDDQPELHVTLEAPPLPGAPRRAPSPGGAPGLTTKVADPAAPRTVAAAAPSPDPDGAWVAHAKFGYAPWRR